MANRKKKDLKDAAAMGSVDWLEFFLTAAEPTRPSRKKRSVSPPPAPVIAPVNPPPPLAAPVVVNIPSPVPSPRAVVAPPPPPVITTSAATDDALPPRLTQEHWQKMRAVALQVVGSESDADDIAQDAMMRAAKNLHRFRGDSQLDTWLYRIAMNLAIDHLRRIKRRGALSYSDDVASEEDVAHSLRGVAPLRPGLHPEANALRSELGNEINAALAELSSDHREIILLRYYHGLAYEQIAQRLGVPLGTVMSRLFYARADLRNMLRSSY